MVEARIEEFERWNDAIQTDILEFLKELLQGIKGCKAHRILHGVGVTGAVEVRQEGAGTLTGMVGEALQPVANLLEEGAQ